MIPSRKPIIGITTFLKPYETELGVRHEEVLDRSYIDMVTDAGAVPLLLPTLSPADASQAISNIDGIILSGGEDDSARDAFEARIVVIARDNRIPLLGVCRGIQILNVALGGTLRTDVSGHCLDDGGMRIQQISVAVGTESAKIVGSSDARVACWHHYAVGNIAPNLRVTGQADDGVVEILEHTNLPIIGVQWHPELLPDSAESRRIMRWLISASGRQREK